MRRSTVRTLQGGFHSGPCHAPLLEYSEGGDHVGRFRTTDRAGAVGGGQYPAVGAYNELRGLNDAATGFPPRADRIRDVLCNAERKRECKAELVGQRPRLCFSIRTGRNDPRAESLELIQFALQAGQLPATEGSPMAAIEESDPVPCIQIDGKPQRAPPDNRQRQHRESIAGIQKGFHSISLMGPPERLQIGAKVHRPSAQNHAGKGEKEAGHQASRPDDDRGVTGEVTGSQQVRHDRQFERPIGKVTPFATLSRHGETPNGLVRAATAAAFVTGLHMPG